MTTKSLASKSSRSLDDSSFEERKTPLRLATQAIDKAPRALDVKEMNLWIVRLSRADTVQESWPRIIFDGMPSILPDDDWQHGSIQRATVASADNSSRGNSIESVPPFVDQAARLDERGQTDFALDLIYDSIDELLRGGKLDRLNFMLARLTPDELSTDILLAILTATLPARSKLAARLPFRQSVDHAIRSRGEYEDGLLAGL